MEIKMHAKLKLIIVEYITNLLTLVMKMCLILMEIVKFWMDLKLNVVMNPNLTVNMILLIIFVKLFYLPVLMILIVMVVIISLSNVLTQMDVLIKVLLMNVRLLLLFLIFVTFLTDLKKHVTEVKIVDTIT